MELSLVGALMAAVSALTGAIIVMYLRAEADYKRCVEAEGKCIDRHIALLERVARLEPLLPKEAQRG